MPMLLDLPLEIQTQICEFLSRSDLKRIRFISRGFNATSERLLFNTIIIKVNIPNFDKLAAIANCRRIRKLSRTVRFDGRELYPSPHQGFEGWLIHNCAQGLGLFQAAEREDYILRQAKERLEQCYANYCDYLSGQKRVLDGNNKLIWLINAFKQLPHLSNIEYHEGLTRWQKAIDWRQHLESSECNMLARDKDWACWNSDRVFERHFWPLLDAANEAGTLVSVESIRAQNLATTGVWTHRRIVQRIQGHIQNLRHLSLEFVPDIQHPKTNLIMGKFLQGSPLLESLKLEYAMNHDRESYEDLIIPLFDSNSQWKFLHKLALGKLTLSFQSLKKLLLDHRATLKELELTDILLRQDKQPPGPARSPWINEVIPLLSRDLCLNHIRLDGDLRTDDSETWSTYCNLECGKVRSGSLQDQIYRYILHLGPYPFRVKGIAKDQIVVEGQSKKRFGALDQSHASPIGPELPSGSTGPITPTWTAKDSWDYDEDESWRLGRAVWKVHG